MNFEIKIYFMQKELTLISKNFKKPTTNNPFSPQKKKKSIRVNHNQGVTIT